MGHGHFSLPPGDRLHRSVSLRRHDGFITRSEASRRRTREVENPAVLENAAHGDNRRGSGICQDQLSRRCEDRDHTGGWWWHDRESESCQALAVGRDGIEADPTACTRWQLGQQQPVKPVGKCCDTGAIGERKAPCPGGRRFLDDQRERRSVGDRRIEFDADGFVAGERDASLAQWLFVAWDISSGIAADRYESCSGRQHLEKRQTPRRLCAVHEPSAVVCDQSRDREGCLDRAQHPIIDSISIDIDRLHARGTVEIDNRQPARPERHIRQSFGGVDLHICRLRPG